VIDAYLTAVAEGENQALAKSDSQLPTPDSSSPSDMSQAGEGRWGSREAEITAVDLVGRDGAAAHVFASGDPVEIRLQIHASRPLDDVVVGVGIFNADGVCCYGTNTNVDGATGGRLESDGEVRFGIDRLDLVEGTYKLDVAVHKANGVPYDYHRLLYTFRVTSRSKEVGVFRPPHRWTFSGGIRLSGL
jgi:hypothetical protein